MVRPVGGRASNKRMPLPSSQELMHAISGQFSSSQLSGMGEIIGHNWKGLPTAASYGAFDEIISVINSNDTMNYFTSDKRADGGYRNLAGKSRFVDPSTRQFYDVNQLTGDETIPGFAGAQNEEDTSAAPLTVVPTSTTNPDRPRTVAAGYDRHEEKITVVFRDGTFYNYYEVTPPEWQAFKSRVSKGQYIYSYLDFKPRGPADVSSMSQASRRAFYRFTRASQIHYRGKQTKNKRA